MLRLAVCCSLMFLSPSAVWAQQHRAEAFAEAAPANVSEPIAKTLSESGVRVLQGARTLCEIWPAKQWDVQADFVPSSSVLYPLSPGELLGVVRYKTKASDFRGQDIPVGTYVMRYARQPVDGNHVGTSDTLDFVLLIPAADDSDPKPMAPQTMFKLSPKTSGGTHPAMLSLLRSDGVVEGLPAMKHDEARELWSVRFAGKGKAGDKTAPLPLDLVVVGRALE
jgi:hypothetical protein